MILLWVIFQFVVWMFGAWAFRKYVRDAKFENNDSMSVILIAAVLIFIIFCAVVDYHIIPRY